MAKNSSELSIEAHRILRLYEMYFSLTFRFMEEYKVNEFSQLMILITIAIANANKILADIESISDEANIPYSTVRRKVEKMCADGVLKARREQNRITYYIDADAPCAHPEQSDSAINKNFQGDVLDIVVNTIKTTILERKA